MTALAVAVAVIAPADAQQATWQRSCRFSVEVDGTPRRDAWLFERAGDVDLLGRLADDSWFLVQPTRREVKDLPPGTAELGPGGTTAFLRGDAPAGGHRLTVTPSGLTFDALGHWMRVLPAPALLGTVSADEFLDLCPDFRARHEAYQPAPDAVRAIAAAPSNLTVEVYFGSWCPHCQEVLPRLIKCLREAGNSDLKVRMIGLPRLFADDPQVKAREVKGVPTIIVFRDGKEVGRFSGGEDAPVEDSLAKLVGG